MAKANASQIIKQTTKAAKQALPTLGVLVAGFVVGRIAGSIAQRTALARYATSRNGAIAVGAGASLVAVAALTALAGMSSKKNRAMAKKSAPFLLAGAFMAAGEPVIQEATERATDAFLRLLPARFQTATPLGPPTPPTLVVSGQSSAALTGPAPSKVARGGLVSDVGDTDFRFASFANPGPITRDAF